MAVKTGKYGTAALSATRFVVAGSASSPVEAWDHAVKIVFPESPTSQKKGCPRGAYLGLAEEGLITGVPTGQYTDSELNKQYALVAHRLLKEQPWLSTDKKQLWKMAAGPEKKENQQMDVVLSLWNAGFLPR